MKRCAYHGCFYEGACPQCVAVTAPVTAKSDDGKPKFDRAKYHREYMRRYMRTYLPKWRAKRAQRLTSASS